jgi:hypothetical protein
LMPDLRQPGRAQFDMIVNVSNIYCNCLIFFV